MSTKSTGSSADKKQGVTMGMDVLDCPVCYEPFKPPILQCSVGHFICSSCRMKLKKCPVCSRTSFERCFGMERVVESIVVPCSYAENGCTNKIHYFNKENHEQACSHGPVRASARTPHRSWKHFTTQHKWPSMEFKYSTPFDVRAGLSVEKTDLRVLREKDDGHVFVVNVVFADPVGHGVSLVSVQPGVVVDGAGSSRFVCLASLLSSHDTGGAASKRSKNVRSSSLSEGPPTLCFFTVPSTAVATKDDGLVIEMTICKNYDIDCNQGLMMQKSKKFERGGQKDRIKRTSYQEELEFTKCRKFHSKIWDREDDIYDYNGYYSNEDKVEEDDYLERLAISLPLGQS